MSRETVFDLASLTKVMATATSIMVLINRGEITFAGRVNTKGRGSAAMAQAPAVSGPPTQWAATSLG